VVSAIRTGGHPELVLEQEEERKKTEPRKLFQKLYRFREEGTWLTGLNPTFVARKKGSKK